MTKWRKSNGGWELHIASTASEWATALLAMTYVLTFTGEFRRVWLSSPVIRVESAGLLAETERGIAETEDIVAAPA